MVIIIKRKENQNVKKNVPKEEQNIVNAILVVVIHANVQKKDQINLNEEENLKEDEENINFII